MNGTNTILAPSRAAAQAATPLAFSRGAPVGDAAINTADGLLKIARAVARAGANALLLDERNRRDEWCSIEHAVALARAFTVEIRRDILALDADNDVACAALNTLFHVFVGDGFRPILIASGSPGRRHLFVVIADDDLRRRYAERARSLGIDVRHSIRPPLSPHRLGYQPVLLYPETVEDALAALEPRPETSRPRQLAPRWWRLLKTGDYREAGYPSRSEAVLAVALAAANAGWTEGRFVAAIANSSLAAKVEARSPVAATKYLSTAWEKARRRVSERPALRRRDEVRAVIDVIHTALADASRWKRAGLSDRAVLAAHATITEKAVALIHYADQRTVADLAGINPSTVRNAHARLCTAGWLQRLVRHTRTKATVWRLTTPRGVEHTAAQPPLHRRGCKTIGRQDVPGGGSEVWSRARGALGKAAELVWLALDADEAVSVSALGRRVDRKRPAVRRQLARLAEFGLAEKSALGWRRGPVLPADARHILGAEVGDRWISVFEAAERQRRAHAERRLERHAFLTEQDQQRPVTARRAARFVRR